METSVQTRKRKKVAPGSELGQFAAECEACKAVQRKALRFRAARIAWLVKFGISFTAVSGRRLSQMGMELASSFSFVSEKVETKEQALRAIVAHYPELAGQIKLGVEKPKRAKKAKAAVAPSSAVESFFD